MVNEPITTRIGSRHFKVVETEEVLYIEGLEGCISIALLEPRVGPPYTKRGLMHVHHDGSPDYDLSAQDPKIKEFSGHFPDLSSTICHVAFVPFKLGGDGEYHNAMFEHLYPLLTGLGFVDIIVDDRRIWNKEEIATKDVILRHDALRVLYRNRGDTILNYSGCQVTIPP